jgi:hypothetical protein
VGLYRTTLHKMPPDQLAFFYDVQNEVCVSFFKRMSPNTHTHSNALGVVGLSTAACVRA